MLYRRKNNFVSLCLWPWFWTEYILKWCGKECAQTLSKENIWLFQGTKITFCSKIHINLYAWNSAEHTASVSLRGSPAAWRGLSLSSNSPSLTVIKPQGLNPLPGNTDQDCANILSSLMPKQNKTKANPKKNRYWDKVIIFRVFHLSYSVTKEMFYLKACFKTIEKHGKW